MKVWQVVRIEQRTCAYGDTHTVSVLAGKRLSDPVGFREHDNGYETRLTELRTDAQGRVYHQQVTIDYYNNVSWLREDGVRFSTRKPRNSEEIGCAR